MESLGAASRAVLEAHGLEVREVAGRGRCLCAGPRGLAAGALVLACPAYGVLPTWEHADVRCDYCLRAPGPDEGDWPRCSGCRRARYCSRECQQAAWAAYHARECRAARWDAEHLAAGALPGASADEVRLCTRLLWQRDVELRRSRGKKQQGMKQQQKGDGKQGKEQQECNTTTSNTSTEPLFEDMEALVSHAERIRREDPVRAEGTQRLAALVVGRHGAGALGGAAVGAAAAEALLYRMQCNDFGVWDGLIVCVGAGVFPAGAMVNHACDANCVVTYAFARGRRPVQQFRACRAVAPHAELTHCYLDLAAPTAARQHALAAQYLFSCTCALCMLPPTPAERARREALDAELAGVAPRPEPGMSDGERARLLAAADALDARGTDLSADPAECCAALAQAAALRARLQPPRALARMTTAAHLMTAALETARWDLARACAEHVLATYRLVYPRVHPMLGLHLYTLGDIARHLRDLPAAVGHYREALAILSLTHGADHPLVQGLALLLRKTALECGSSSKD